VVSRDLKRAAHVPHIATTLQAAIDDWERAAPRLTEAFEQLERGNNRSTFPFEARRMSAPLPRAYQWADGSSYVNHIELVRKARGAEMPPSLWTDPLMYQGGSDDLLGPMEEAIFVSEDHGIDLEAEVAVITDDVPLGVTPDQARGHIKLLMLVNDWSLRNLVPAELAKGFGFAGTIIGSGTVSNQDRSAGSSCLAEKRSLEQIAHGKPSTPFLKFGDRVRIEMLDANGQSLFGAIEQKVVKA
jgi:fumarylacetoacetate (FAA) hydrolase